MSGVPFELPGFVITRVYSLQDTMVISAQAIESTAYCPSCQQPSGCVHSYYQRTPKDLSVSGKQVRLLLTVRRFRCTIVSCARKVFAERLPKLLAPNAQHTNRLTQTLQIFADNFSAKLAARVLTKLNMPTSPDTLLRLLKKTSADLTNRKQNLRVISVDDFAFKRGRTYGTLILDLETHRPVDLLPDRSAATLADWLKRYPSIKIVSRDRSPEYASGITAGAPQALQVADRWHLLKNWRDVLERIFTGQHNKLNEQLSAAGLSVKTRRKRQRTVTERVSSAAARQRRLARYDQVKQLHEQGHTILQISEELKMSRVTVRKFLSLEKPPAPIEHRRVTQIVDPYLSYLEKRWGEGCHNAQQLWRELKAQGFKGSHKPVQRWAELHRDQPGRLLSQREKARREASGIEVEPQLPALTLEKQTGPGFEALPAPHQLVWLFLKPPDKLKQGEQKWLEFIEQDRTLAWLKCASQEFVAMVRERKATGLDDWLEAASQSAFVDVQTFGEGLRREYEAVKAGLTLVWSQGPTEGHINKLKMLKRTSYGRGSFEQLRQRVLRAS